MIRRGGGLPPCATTAMEHPLGVMRDSIVYVRYLSRSWGGGGAVDSRSSSLALLGADRAATISIVVVL